MTKAGDPTKLSAEHPTKLSAEGRFFSRAADGSGQIQCSLCPRRCRLSDGQTGACRVRVNRGGKMELPFYGFVTARAWDPIEKKPLCRFRPGSAIFSAGFAGCNLRCPFCQNWHISQQTAVAGERLGPEELVAAARAGDTPQIAYTYSEPLVHIEFLLECMRAARKAGLANVLVSNGCVNAEAAEEVLALTDAANIDLKCFSAETYAKTLGGDLGAVLSFIERAHKMAVHLELTTLVVPGLNDGDDEINRCIDFIARLDAKIPWHLTAYHPAYRWAAPPTEPARLLELARRARQRLAFVRTGNIPGHFNTHK